jgi:hypothetical protein
MSPVREQNVCVKCAASARGTVKHYLSHRAECVWHVTVPPVGEHMQITIVARQHEHTFLAHVAATDHVSCTRTCLADILTLKSSSSGHSLCVCHVPHPDTAGITRSPAASDVTPAPTATTTPTPSLPPTAGSDAGSFAYTPCTWMHTQKVKLVSKCARQNACSAHSARSHLKGTQYGSAPAQRKCRFTPQCSLLGQLIKASQQ